MEKKKKKKDHFTPRSREDLGFFFLPFVGDFSKILGPHMNLKLKNHLGMYNLVTESSSIASEIETHTKSIDHRSSD
jgi:hypothetical protein